MAFFTIQKQGYFILFSDTPHSENDRRHYLCGPHNIEGAQCPNCNKPLLLFLTIDLTDERLSLSNDSFDKLPFLFCWTCTLAQDLFYYKIKNNDKVDILYYKKGEMESDFPYPKYPIYFPQKYARLEEITSYYQDILTKLNGERITPYEAREMDLKHSFLQHQICGEPFLIQGDIDILSCPICKQQMAFLVKIGDDCGDSRGFVGNAWVQVNYYYCKKCFVVGTMQQCD